MCRGICVLTLQHCVCVSLWLWFGMHAQRSLLYGMSSDSNQPLVALLQ